MSEVGEGLKRSGEDFEIRRGGVVVGKVRGNIPNRISEKLIVFAPESDIQVGDIAFSLTYKRIYEIEYLDKYLPNGVFHCWHAFHKDTQTASVNIVANQSAIQVASPGAYLNFTITNDNKTQLTTVVVELLESVDTLELSETDKELLKDTAEFLKKNIESAEPDKGLLGACLNTIKTHLGKAAATALASGVISKAPYLVEQFSKLFK